MAKPFAWSYSSLSSFEQCPWRWYLTRIAKTASEKQTSATLYGNQVHKAFELRIRDGTPFSPEFAGFEPIAKTIADGTRGKTVETEQKIALNKDLREVKYFASDVWLRNIMDLSVEKGVKAVVIDYKTGKKTPDSQQLALSSAVYFARAPWIKEVKNIFVWLKTGETTVETFEHDQAPAIWNTFHPRVRRIEEAIALDKFPKRPSGLCREYCPVGKKLCEHCGLA